MATLEVVSWNVLAQAYMRDDLYAHVAPEAKEANARRTRVVERIMKRAGAAAASGGDNGTVIALQEADEALVAELKRRFAGEKHVAFAQKEGRPDGLALVVDVPIVIAPLATLSFGDGTGHVAQLMKIEGPREVIVLANAHFKWDAPNTPVPHRVGLAQADALLAHLDELDAGAVVVTGDFNARPDDALLELFAAAGFVDVNNGAATAVANGRASRIDYIMVSGDLAPRARALPPSFALRDDDALPHHELPSDHAPIGVVIEG